MTLRITARALATILLAAVGDAGCSGGSFDVAQGGPDAGAEVGVETGADASSTGWCNAHAAGAVLCEDFDSVGSISELVTRWAGELGGNGTLSLSQPAGAVSPPHALLATAGNDDQAYVAHAPWPLGSKPSTIRLEYDLRVDRQAVGFLDAAVLCAIVLGTNPQSDAIVYLYIGNKGALNLGWNDSQAAGRNFHFTVLNMTPTAGQWSGRWGVSANLNDGSLTVTHDGVNVGRSNGTLKPQDLSPTAITLAAGLSNDTGNTGAVSVAIDNLVFDTK